MSAKATKPTEIQPETVPDIVQFFRLGAKLKASGFDVKLTPVKTYEGDWLVSDDSVRFTPAFHIYASKTARINNAQAKIEEYQAQIDEKTELIAKAVASKGELDNLERVYSEMEFDQDDLNSQALKIAKQTEINALKSALGDYEGFLEVYQDHINKLEEMLKPYQEELTAAQAIELPEEREYPLSN